MRRQACASFLSFTSTVVIFIVSSSTEECWSFCSDHLDTPPESDKVQSFLRFNRRGCWELGLLNAPFLVIELGNRAKDTSVTPTLSRPQQHLTLASSRQPLKLPCSDFIFADPLLFLRKCRYILIRLTIAGQENIQFELSIRRREGNPLKNIAGSRSSPCQNASRAHSLGSPSARTLDRELAG